MRKRVHREELSQGGVDGLALRRLSCLPQIRHELLSMDALSLGLIGGRGDDFSFSISLVADCLPGLIGCTLHLLDSIMVIIRDNDGGW
jgi:hypothetical protein